VIENHGIPYVAGVSVHVFKFGISRLFKGEDMKSMSRFAVSAVGAVVLSISMVPVAMAGGAGGGSFTCDQSGIPGWGHVTSSYRHPSRSHYATAKGTGYVTTQANAGTWAVARTGRAASGNQCYWGIY
jgi:hypothetical protein